jgi:hypothetical protein
MPCCGGRRANSSARSNPMTERIDVGSEGMVRVEYVGGNVGTNTFFGCFTGARYVAGGSRKFIFVDERDLQGTEKVPGIVELMRDDKKVFVLAPEEAEVSVAIADLTVSDIKDIAFESDGDVIAALNEEQAGKDRKSVVEYLEKLLAEESDE